MNSFFQKFSKIKLDILASILLYTSVRGLHRKISGDGSRRNLYFVFILLFFVTNSSQAQLTFNNGLTALQLAQMLAGPGVTISNATINCAPNAIGSFNGSSSIGITNGILLTTGSTSIASPNTGSSSAGVCNNTPGDPQLNSLAGSTTYDGCSLEFDIVPLCDTVKFKYVFGSEEYPEFVNQGFSDAFAFFISGPGITGQPNIALVPGTTTPVTIDNVNIGNNSQYYVTNSGTTIEYDGYTTVLTAWAVVQPCQTYHMKLVIVDAGDCIYDSGVFLEAGSLQCQTTISATATVQNAIEGCQNGAVQFCRAGSTASPVTVNYTIAGTATNGTDYNTITNSVIIPAGQACVILPIIPIADGIPEPTETVLLIYQPGTCPVMDTAKVFITDGSPMNAGPDTSLCSGGSVTIGIPPVAGTTYSWTPATGLSSSTSSNPSLTLTNVGSVPVTTNYILTANTGGCIAIDTVAVKVYSMPTVNAGPDQTTCNSSWVQLHGISGGGATSITWSGGAGLYNPSNTNLSNVYTPSSAEVDAGGITLILTTNGSAATCPAAIDSVKIFFNAGAVVSASIDQVICAGTGNTITLNGSVSGSTTSGIWSGGSGTYNPNDTTLNAVYTLTPAEVAADSVILTLTSVGTSGSCPPVTDQMKIQINHSPTANAGSAQHVCSGTGVTLNGSIGGTASIGIWSGGAGTYSPNNTTLNAIYIASATEFAAGSVTLTLTTDDPVGPCTFSSSNVTLYFYQNPVVNFTADSTAGCKIHCTTFTNLTTIAGTDTLLWNWDFGDNGAGSDSTNPSHCFAQTGYYDIKLTATSSHGCTSSLTKFHFVHVFANPVAEFNPTPNPATVIDPTITFNNLSSSDVSIWHWNFGDGSTNTLAPNSSPDHTYPSDSSGSYLVTLIVRNTSGCWDTVVHEIVIEPGFTFFIPNSFSPNADKINDYFFASGIGIFKFDLWIFDRWGNLIFHGNDLNDKWDGRANDGDMVAQMDVFVWKVDLTDLNNKKHNYIGTVTLVK